MSPAEARSLFEVRRTAWLAEDIEAYLALWAGDLVIELPGRSEPVRGKTAYRRVVESSFRFLRAVRWDFHRIAVDGDHVLSEWTIAGEVRATGTPIAWRGMAICRIENGLIQEWREYWDPAQLVPRDS